MIGGKQIGGPRPGGRNQDGHGTTKSKVFFLSQNFAPKGKTNLIIKSMLCRTLILFPQMSNPQVVKLLLYVFEDNEAMIKMIMKGRSPTMRHVSRTHRVALDWLFDRINLDPKIQIKYIDTKNQLADILTQREFHTRWVESFVDLV